MVSGLWFNRRWRHYLNIVWSGDEESDIILRIYNDLLHLLDEIRGEVEEIAKTNRNGQLEI